MIQTLKKLGMILLALGLAITVCYAIYDGFKKSDIANCNKELEQSKTYSQNYFITKLQWDICSDFDIQIDPKFIVKSDK